MSADPLLSLIQDAIIDVDQFLGLREGLQDEGGEEEATLLVALTEGGEAAITVPVGKLPLIAGDHQFLCLGHYLWLELSALLKVFGDKSIGGKHYHVLLAAAKGHLDKSLETFDSLRQVAGGHCYISPA